MVEWDKRVGGRPFASTPAFVFKMITGTLSKNPYQFPGVGNMVSTPYSNSKSDSFQKILLYGVMILPMRRPQKGSTIKQYAYATRRLNGQGRTKKEIALLSGYTKSMAENAKAKIEDTEGYQNAVIVLAGESNNLLLAVMAEFKARGLKKFSNADLTKALNAISGAWDRIEKVRAPNQMKTPEGNRLRGLFTRTTETAVIETVPPTEATASAPQQEITDVVAVEAAGDDLDF